jgi:very-short-patch-repair endonuclease
MKRKIIPYKPYLKELAKQLRQNSTLAEVLLWDQLKSKQLLGLDFDRQKPLGNYIVDFYCKELMLAIEIDGDSHDYKYQEDIARQQELEELGIRFLRFDDLEVKKDIHNVLRVIEAWVIENQRLQFPIQVY